MLEAFVVMMMLLIGGEEVDEVLANPRDKTPVRYYTSAILFLNHQLSCYLLWDCHLDGETEDFKTTMCLDGVAVLNVCFSLTEFICPGGWIFIIMQWLEILRFQQLSGRLIFTEVLFPSDPRFTYQKFLFFHEFLGVLFPTISRYQSPL